MKRKKDKAYLFKGKQRLSMVDKNINQIYGHLSAKELLTKYYAYHPKPVNENSERFKRMFKQFD